VTQLGPQKPMLILDLNAGNTVTKPNNLLLNKEILTTKADQSNKIILL